jgi:hypothetical protein
VSAPHAEFVGRLVPFALRLHSRGVIIVDEAGEELGTVTCVKQGKGEGMRSV